MAQTETINILRIDGTQAVTTLRQLKEEIEKDKDALVALGLVEDSDVKKKEQQEAITAKLNNDLKLLNQVMQAGKTTTLAAAKATQVGTASYYEMQKALTTLKKAWKDLSAEERQNAEGVEILNKIKQLDAQLKTLDSDIGQFQRNVGNYGKTFKESLQDAQQGVMGLMQGAQALSGIIALGGEKSEGWQKAILGLHSAVLVLQSARGMGGLIEKIKNWIKTENDATASANNATLATKTQTSVTNSETVSEVANAKAVVDVTKAKAGETAATKAQTTAMVAETTATNTATIATKAFKTALISTGMGAIVVLVGELIANLDKLVELFSSSGDAAMKAFKQQKEEIDGIADALEHNIALFEAEGYSREQVLFQEYKSYEQLIQKYGELVLNLEKGTDIYDESMAALRDAMGKAEEKLQALQVAAVAFASAAETKKAQQGMSELDVKIQTLTKSFGRLHDAVRHGYDMMGLTVEEANALLKRLQNAYEDEKQRLRDEDAKKTKEAAAARVKTEKEAAEKIANDAALALKTEEERLTLKYEEDKAKLEKFHIDTTALEAKYQADLKAIRKKADAQEQAEIDARQAVLDKQAEENYRREVAANKKASEAKLTQLEQDAEAEAQRAQYTIDNNEELANRTYEIEMASYQARLEALQAFIEQANAINDTETALQYQQEAADLSVQIELRALEEKQRIRERDKKNQQASAKQIVASTSTIFGAMAEIYEANGKEDAKAQKKAKNLRIAGATIDMFQGAVTAYSTAQSLGPIAGPIVGAINAAAVIAAGTANIAKIKAQDVSGSGDSSAGAATATVEAPSVEPVVNEVRTVTSASEEDRLNSMAKDQRVYILSSDIEADQQQKRVQVAESTF